MTFLLLLFLTWVEIGSFFGGEVDHQFHVDNTVSRNMTINLDILVAMPCNFIQTNVRDLTYDRFLAAEKLQYEGMSFFLPHGYQVNSERHIVTPELDEIMAEGIRAEFLRRESTGHNLGSPACHIFGSIPVNRVAGDFHITAKGFGYRDRTQVQVESLNFTHVISEFSFGDFYPYIDNPLDATAKTTEENLKSYTYFLTVVPTVYKKLGVAVNTNQYSVGVQEKTYTVENRGPPGIFFKYDFEPLLLVVEDQRMSFTTFLVRLATIYGGIIVCAQWMNKFVEKMLLVLFGKRYASRGLEKSASLLDDDL
ncbi:unnamed protein product [Cyberlindnera jadinii]|uniref:Endoplasmic reticulum-Golgi intermediate compartment protein n=1 Tax=Cyberlindnera jadinii (strain ATCC 18201 / CBS 1600 / BCRC 20928 / JCM 3617 / NBRC 0987 / NRRL Y-1542) TaxID=983966 RepID=A0A0H5BZH2_CYBJN|nr:unnamed protein product [Cyberlindnera jadinii]